MITRKDFEQARARAAAMMKEAGILATDKEIAGMDVADFGLGDYLVEGAQMTAFADTKRIAVKVIVLFPNQTLPEHWHSSNSPADPGKEETFRVVGGKLRLYVPGDDGVRDGFIPKGKDACYTARREIVMLPGDQLTLDPGVKHWLQGGPEGAVLYSYSSFTIDALDPFTDPDIVRVTKIIE